MTDIRKIRQGEVLSGIPASGWNAFIDTKKKVDQLLPRGVGKTSPIGDRRITCKVFNATGVAIDADFPVLKLDSPLYNSDDDPAVIRREIAFNGTTPDSDTQQGNVAILQSPVGTGGNGIRKAVIQGPTWADVEFTAKSHTHAAVKSGDNAQLESASSGIQILGHPTIPDEEYLPATLRCLVMLGGGGIGEHRQLIRGTAVANVLETDEAFQLENLVPLEEHAALPDSPVWVANIPAVAVTMGDSCLAAYRAGIPVTHTGAPETADWEYVPTTAGASTPPGNEFELTATKTRAQDTATGKFLDHDGNPVGDEITFHDPAQRFAGKIASYVGSEAAFRGLALLQSDRAESDPAVPRWLIDSLEGMADWIVVDLYSTDPIAWRMVAGAFGGDEWNNRRPVADEGDVTIVDPLNLATGATSGTTFLARLADPDTSPPTYRLWSFKPDDRKVASGPTDTVPATLIEKLHNTGEYNELADALVKFEEFDDGGTRRVRGSVPIESFDGLLIGQVRRFILSADKLSSSATASVLFVDPAEAATAHDPGLRFAGYAGDSLYEGQPAFEGYAAWVNDQTGESEDLPRWEIIAMESLLPWISGKIEFDSISEEWFIEFTGAPSELFGPDPWARQPPCEIGELVLAAEQPNPALLKLSDGASVLCKLVDPDIAPTYLPVSRSDESRRLIRGRAVAEYGAGTASYLIDSIVALASGLDPSNGDPDVAVAVANIHGDSYAVNEWIEAAFRESTNSWHALRKGGGSSGGALVTILISTNVPIAFRVGTGATAVLNPGHFNARKFFDDSGVYSRGLEDIPVENHDTNFSLAVPTGREYIAFATYNEFGKLVLHTATCRAWNFDED